MSDEIRPALSAEEWKGSTADVLDGYVDLDTGTVDVRLGGAGSQSRSQHDDAWALVALLNDSLPDDDPRKVTWEIHDAIMWAISDYESEAGFMDETQQREHAAMLRGLAIIASLLPPREGG